MELFQDFLIHLVLATFIPKTVDYDFASFCHLTEPEAISEVVLKGNGQIVGLKGMERDVDLMQGRGGKKQLLFLL